MDQKPDDAAEMRRITAAGGHVSPPEDWGGPARVWTSAEMVMPGLAMARSIGDHLVKRVGVIAEPVVTREVWDLTAQDATPDFVILASDGVWEFIESEAAVQLVAQHIGTSAKTASESLIAKAEAEWQREEGDYRDDITAICIKLDGIFV